jgi:lysozyme family protein
MPETTTAASLDAAIPAAIDTALDLILQWEGPRSDDAGDAGGLTVWGVSERWARDIRLDLNGDGLFTDADLDLVTPAIAKQLFYRAFYLAPHFDRLPSIVAPALIQLAINCGAGRATIELQDVLDSRAEALGQEGLTADGLIGPRTVAAAQAAATDLGTGLVDALLDAQLKYYKDIVARHPAQRQFLRGWQNRVAAFRPVAAAPAPTDAPTADA